MFFKKSFEENCHIEYLEVSKYYYPKYKGQYIRYWDSRGYFLDSDNTGNTLRSRTLEGAKEILKLYKESLGLGIKVIKVDEL